MSYYRLEEVYALLKENRYEEARVILETIATNFEAQQWLKVIAGYLPPECAELRCPQCGKTSFSKAVRLQIPFLIGFTVVGGKNYLIRQCQDCGFQIYQDAPELART